MSFRQPKNIRVYRWVVGFSSALVLLCTSGIATTGMNAYQPFIISVSGLSNAQASTAMMVRNLVGFVAIFFLERFYRITNMRLGLSLSALSIAAGFAVYSRATGFWGYCLGSALNGIGYGLGGIVTVSVMIHRWFKDHQGLALGLCSACTGLSPVIAIPITTSMIRKYSMPFTFMATSALMAGIAALTFLLLRDNPDGSRSNVEWETQKERFAGAHCYRTAPKLRYFAMFGVLLMGFIQPSSTHLSVLYTHEGWDPMLASYFVSVMGIALMVGKSIYGEAVDLLGSYRAGFLFYGAQVMGLVLCCGAAVMNRPLAFAAMALLGLGYPVLSIGQSFMADIVAKPEHFATVLKQFQIIYVFGTLLAGSMPGIIADLFDSYIPAFALMALMALLCMISVQYIQRQSRSSENMNTIKE